MDPQGLLGALEKERGEVTFSSAAFHNTRTSGMSPGNCLPSHHPTLDLGNFFWGGGIILDLVFFFQIWSRGCSVRTS